ncbi:hypothetical protein Agub_g8903, partial [Astrephomene gubernaculifera]
IDAVEEGKEKEEEGEELAGVPAEQQPQLLLQQGTEERSCLDGQAVGGQADSSACSNGCSSNDSSGLAALQAAAALSAAGGAPGESARSGGSYEDLMAAEEDGDDFVFEDLEVQGTAPAAAPALSTRPVCPSSSHPSSSTPPYSWPALRSRLLHLSSHVSYVLLDDPGLWTHGSLLGGVFQLLRALGAHRHAGELAPLLHAYVG